MSDPITWTNERRRLGDLHPWPINPRQIKKDQAKRLSDSLDRYGQVDIIAVEPDNEVVNGHQRLNVWMQEHGADYEVDVRVASRKLTDDEKKRLTVYLHQGAVGEWDFDLLANNFELPDLLEWGFDAKSLDMDMWQGDAPEDPGAQIDRAEELREQWGVELGQLWRIPSKMADGEHRIMCGDCTDRAVVERVMQGERAQLIWTDPPYGVKYGDKLEAANTIAHRVRTIENDNLPADQLEEFIRSAMRLAAEFSDSGSAIYVASPPGTLLPALIASFAGSGFDYHWGLIWLKDQLVLSRADYHFRHENILYGWKPDGAHYFTADRTQDSVFVVDRPKRSEEHPTMKPVELVERMVKNSSKPSEIIYDGFLGSGTTLVACERLGRLGRGIEISPAYVAVSLQRLADMGLEPMLEEQT